MWLRKKSTKLSIGPDFFVNNMMVKANILAKLFEHSLKKINLIKCIQIICEIQTESLFLNVSLVV